MLLVDAEAVARPQANNIATGFIDIGTVAHATHGGILGGAKPTGDTVRLKIAAHLA